jgi:hypothetical protein
MKIKNLQFFSVTVALIFILFTSSNLFSQWTFVGGIVGAGTYPSISVSGTNTVFVFGGPNGQPRVFLSTNGGANFTTLGSTGLGSLELYCGWGTNANLIFAGNGGGVGGTGGNASYYKTTNGGTTWTTIGSTGGTAAFFNGIVFSKITPTFGVAQSDPPLGAGTPYYFPISTNGGTTWTVTNPPGIPGAASAQNSIMVIDNQFFGFGLNAGAARIYMTTNGGTSWFIGNLGISGNFVSGFAFSEDKMRGIAISSTSLPTISRTTNGGATWTPVNTGTGIGGGVSCKWIPGTNVCYVAGGTGASGVIGKSTDGGATWTQMTTSSLTGVAHFEFYSAVTADGITAYGYAIAGDGSVLKLVDVLTGVGNNNGTIPAEYKLEQNFPNPFNPSTTINFSIPRASHVSLKVYNALGKEVASIVDDYMQAGEHSEGFAVNTDLTSGIYFYKLTAGDFTDTKKMMLIK